MKIKPLISEPGSVITPATPTSLGTIISGSA
jgi:hypothetical protein